MGLSALLALSGCLPREAISRREELEAQLYDAEVSVATTTDGLPVEPFAYTLRAKLAWSYARTFRDGSLGQLVEVREAHATVSRGATVTEVPTPLQGAVVELRSFPDGQLLAVTGASAWSGDHGHLEMLEGLWPGLSPHLPGPRAEMPFLTSFPTWIADGGASPGPRLRNTLTLTWDAATRRSWHYEGTWVRNGAYVEGKGAVAGDLEIGVGDVRVASHTSRSSGATVTKWPGGTVRQELTTTYSLTHAGSAPAARLNMPVRGADIAADALPLTLEDGRAARDTAIVIADTAPFVLLPDDLPPERRAALRTQLTSAGSIRP